MDKVNNRSRLEVQTLQCKIKSRLFDIFQTDNTPPSPTPCQGTRHLVVSVFNSSKLSVASRFENSNSNSNSNCATLGRRGARVTADVSSPRCEPLLPAVRDCQRSLQPSLQSLCIELGSLLVLATLRRPRQTWSLLLSSPFSLCLLNYLSLQILLHCSYRYFYLVVYFPPLTLVLFHFPFVHLFFLSISNFDLAFIRHTFKAYHVT